MTPVQKLKHLILIRHAEFEGSEFPIGVSANDIDELWNIACENDDGTLQDAKNEIRCSDITSGINCPSSRHYESHSVADKADDGSWIGWTYWHGGGKHGEPESVDWIEHAYNLSATEEEKLVIVRTFSKVE